MNITPHTANLPLATVVNPPTEGLRRENHQREIITQVAAANSSAAEKGVASDKERARTPAQNNEQIDFTNLRKQAEHAASSIAERENQQGSQQQNEQNPKQNQEEQSAKPNNNADDKAADISHEKESADERIISQLQDRDKEVRAHELAHATTGGAATGAPSFTYEVGPDGKKYAVGGEVSVDLSSVAGDPQATIIKMQKVHAAALAPANPSTQDTRVAASAIQKILTAQSELQLQTNDASPEKSTTNNSQQVRTNATFNDSIKPTASNEFDTLIKQTLLAQDDVISNAENTKLSSNAGSVQSDEVQQRAQRVESYYFKVSQGYEKPDNFQFQLTA
jgi:hypothetical protein